MLNADAKLSEKVFAEDIEQAPTRDGFGTGTIEAGKADSNVVVLCADLAESTRAEWFQKEFPERFIEMGVAEQNMATVAAGMAAVGKIPFIASYAVFNPGRNYEQIRTTIALNSVPVKICGMHAGVSVGPDGATHQMLEDIGMMRMLPGMTVIVPADAEEARKAVVAAKALSEEGIESVVLHVPTVKPLDETAVLEAAKRAGRVVTIEEHQAMGGFGSATAQHLSHHQPLPVRRLGVIDQFGQSGTPDEL